MLLDTYCWIELFIGSEKGKKVEGLIKSGNKIYTSTASLSEITFWCLKNNKSVKERLDIVKNNSEILGLDETIAELAGRLNFEARKTVKDFGMLDALIYSTAQIYGMKLVTGDKHFEKLKDAILL